jgi:hypothetical protein
MNILQLMLSIGPDGVVPGVNPLKVVVLIKA